jgi:hypothetical protein
MSFRSYVEAKITYHCRNNPSQFDAIRLRKRYSIKNPCETPLAVVGAGVLSRCYAAQERAWGRKIFPKLPLAAQRRSSPRKLASAIARPMSRPRLFEAPLTPIRKHGFAAEVANP